MQVRYKPTTRTVIRIEIRDPCIQPKRKIRRNIPKHQPRVDPPSRENAGYIKANDAINRKEYAIPGICIFFVSFPTSEGYLLVEYNGTWTFQLIRVTSFLIVFLPHCIRSLCTRTINGIYWLRYVFLLCKTTTRFNVCVRTPLPSFLYEDMMRAAAIYIEMTPDCTVHWQNYCNIAFSFAFSSPYFFSAFFFASPNLLRFECKGTSCSQNL